jgi:poly-beta-1,6-N-acetyl-D-glucosamine synthase
LPVKLHAPVPALTVVPSDRVVDGVLERSPRPTCSAGIMAYNEDANIAAAMNAILVQRVASCDIPELIVVASGCTDRTVEIVETAARRDSRVRLIVQEHRLGKASAINEFVRSARASLLLMVGADVLVKDGTLDALLRHFSDPRVGMVGGHPVPVNDEATFVGHAVHLLWRLHDRLSRVSPKLGEIVAFRNVIPSIPPDTAVDEISIQALISQMGYQLVYEPAAIVYNHGPGTVGDFIRQRRRIHAGHLRVRRQQAYAASTMSVLRIGRSLVGSGSFTGPRAATWTLSAMALEAYARSLGLYDHLRSRSHHVWEAVGTTKRHIEAAAEQPVEQTVLVFNVVDFHWLRLELGLRASHRLTHEIALRIRQTIGHKGAVSVRGDGPIVVWLAADRTEAERTAAGLLDDFHRRPVPVAGRQDVSPVKLACGIVTFSHGGPAILELAAGSAQSSMGRAVAG